MKEKSKAFLRFGELYLDRLSQYDFLKNLTKESPHDIHRLIAVRDTLKALKATGNTECADAVYQIYFSQRKSKLSASDISFAVRKFASEHYLDERTVYRRLQKAGDLYLAFLSQYESCASA